MTDTLIEHLPFTTDEGVGNLARVGLIVLATDYTIEYEFRQVFDNPGIGLFAARINNETTITPDTLAAMSERIPTTLELILPGEKLDVVAYGCTSASTVLGEEEVFARIHSVHPGTKCTTPVTAAFAAFDAFDAKRIAVLTPYRADVNAVVRSYIEKAGYDVPVFGSFNEENDPTVARIDTQSLVGAIDRISSEADVDMVFVSCTSVRLMDAVADIEKRTGLPVTSSNHAMAWHTLRLAGMTDVITGRGRLYEKQLI